MKSIEELHKKFKWHPNKNFPIMVSRLPQEIQDEINIFVDDVKIIKQHKLGFLKKHIYASISSNQFQSSLTNNINSSFLLAYINHICDYYITSWGNYPKLLNCYTSIKQTFGIYNGYEAWINIATKGHYNKAHIHTPGLSGIIYIKDEEKNPTIFYKIKDNPPNVTPEISDMTADSENVEDKIIHQGKTGEILVFPSWMPHEVKKKKTNKERITLSFNVNVPDYLEGLNDLHRIQDFNHRSPHEI